jgi:LysM repeat protein
MVRCFLLLLMGFLFQVNQVQATAVAFDSVGVETKNGKSFVVHKVEPKETLYALSRKYRVPVPQIVDANANIESGITIGQLVYIPRKGKVPASSATPSTSVANAATKPSDAPKTNRTFTIDESGRKIHVVQPKQTLYSLSRMYNVTTEDIRKWNNLPSDNISIGAPLIVGHNEKATKALIYIPEADDAVPATNVSAPEPVAITPILPAEPAEAAGKEELKEETVKAEKKEGAEEMPSSRIADNVGKVIETGLAEVIDQKGEVNKYLALHKTAPVGTILQVKNIMNGQTVYVRVIGNLPSTGANEKVIVKISKKAHQKLAALDNKFRVELSYMP